MSIYDLEAYQVIQKADLSDIKSRGTLLKHKKSGARVLLMENDDENKVFAIGFRTPPSDSTEFRISWSIPYSAAPGTFR